MRRRTFLRLATITAAGSACPVPLDPTSSSRSSRFVHGVASGDPLPNRVVLWTRVTVDPPEPCDVEWTIAEDPELERVVSRGTVTTDARRDHTVKVDVGGLQPGRTYHYRFTHGTASSPIGRTRTLPVGPVDAARLAFTSCAHYRMGHFNVYAAIARRDDLDLVVGLGDYIYEGGNDPDARTLPDRPFAPDHECLSLADYRVRYASYRADGDLQELHRRHPFVGIWDDHEISNNAWSGGAQNHQAEDGDWIARRIAAVRAYGEWMPIREGSSADPQAIYRDFRIGDLLDLLVLDARLIGRDQHAPPEDVGTLARMDRSLLGEAQEAWLLDRLAGSQRDGVAWRVLGQQVRMAQVRDELGFVRNTDMWDGYPAARDRILAFVESNPVRDLVVLTGDIHSSWAIELHRDPFAARPGDPIAVELTVPGVSSPPPVDPPAMDALFEGHPHLRWVDMQHRGYVLLDVTPTAIEATWHLVADVSTRHTDVPAAKSFAVARGSARLSERMLVAADLTRARG
jgi:alkaline phosphatase D